jgi:hypothetical protein
LSLHASFAFVKITIYLSQTGSLSYSNLIVVFVICKTIHKMKNEPDDGKLSSITNMHLLKIRVDRPKNHFKPVIINLRSYNL